MDGLGDGGRRLRRFIQPPQPDSHQRFRPPTTLTRRIEGGVTYSQTFDVENRLSAVITTAGGTLFTTTFRYDGNGNLVQRIRPDNTGSISVWRPLGFGNFRHRLKADAFKSRKPAPRASQLSKPSASSRWRAGGKVRPEK
jgi:hypothetical protein